MTEQANIIGKTKKSSNKPNKHNFSKGTKYKEIETKPPKRPEPRD